MTNLEKLNDIFIEVFNVEVSELGVDFSKDTIDDWDSIRQLTLITSIEDAFDVLLDTEDIIKCNSYEEVKEILRNYDIAL